MPEKRHFSAASRRRCAEAGAPNLIPYRIREAKTKQLIERRSRKIRRELIVQLGHVPVGAEAALFDSALACHRMINTIAGQLTAGTGRISGKRMQCELLLKSLTSLQRTLRVLGLRPTRVKREDSQQQMHEILKEFGDDLNAEPSEAATIPAEPSEQV